MIRIDSKKLTDKENVKTVKAVINGTEVIYRLLRGYSADHDCFVYSLLITLFENGGVSDEEYAFDVTRNGSNAAKIFDLTVRYGLLPSSFHDGFEFILDKII